tara:strand:+ start:1080 stop:1856 length:777 start_codon:yes stop_codon:yes gene_type:complete
MTDNDWYIEDLHNEDVLIREEKLEFGKPISSKNYTISSFGINRKINDNAICTLIGDSMIDNSAYTGTGKGTVDYLRAKSKVSQDIYNDQAVDGYVVSDCISSAHKVRGDYVVISAGGNDLLDKMSLLSATDDTNLLMGIMQLEIDKLTQAYETLLSQLSKKDRTFVFLTCYTGNLAYNPTRFDNVDNITNAVVSMWNDRLYSLANKYNRRNNSQTYDVIDTREFMTVDCYYNEIEPNDKGARRIANNIHKYLQQKGVF